MVNPAHIDLFRAVMRHGGMTRAAEALGVGQPYISRAISQLEADIGFQLFVRGHGVAQPTREGVAFSHEVARTYAGLEQLRNAARQIREIGTGSLRIACQPSLAARLVPRSIQKLRQMNPSVRVSLHVPSPDTIWTLASSGQCDVGLVRPRSGISGVACEPFLQVDAVCALPRGHALVRKRAITVSDLAETALIAGGPGDFQQAVEDAFMSAGIRPRFTLMAQYTAARCGLVSEGLGVAIVDPLPARELIGLPFVLRPFQPRLPIRTELIRPASMPPDSLTERFLDILRTERDALKIR